MIQHRELVQSYELQMEEAKTEYFAPASTTSRALWLHESYSSNQLGGDSQNLSQEVVLPILRVT